MKFIIGQKVEMTQRFSETGAVVPVTRVIAGPCTVIQVKGAAKNGYTAVQVGFGRRRHISKPLSGHLKKLGSLRHLKEFRLAAPEAGQLKVGDTITAGV